MVENTVKSQILDVIFRKLDKEKLCVVLFGSSAYNRDTPYSDIDIGLFYSKPIDDNIFLSLKDDLNLLVDTGRIIDLVDFSRVDKEFLEFALKEAIIWHIGIDFLKNLTKLKEL